MAGALGPPVRADDWPSTADSADLEIVCDLPPVFEPFPAGERIVQVVGSALQGVGSRMGLSDLADPPREEEAATDATAAGLRLPPPTPAEGSPSLRRLPLVQSLPGSLHQLVAAATAGGCGEEEEGRPGAAASPSVAAQRLRIDDLGLPGLLKRRISLRLPSVTSSGGHVSPSGANVGHLPTVGSSAGLADLIPQVIGDASKRRASILDFEHLFSQYYVEVRLRSSFWDFRGLGRPGALRRRLLSGRRGPPPSAAPHSELALPEAEGVAEAWKEAALEYIWEHRAACQQHWPQLRLSRAALSRHLAAELAPRGGGGCGGGSGRRRVVLALEAERVIHRLLWAVGDAFPPGQFLASVESSLQARWPHCRVRCRDDLVRPPNIFSFVLLVLTLLLSWSLWALARTAAVVWALPPDSGRRPSHDDPSQPTRDERLDQLAARVLVCGSLATFWLLHALAAAFPLRSLHSPFKRDLGCLCAYSTRALRLCRLLGPCTAVAMPVAMAIRFDRLGLPLIVPMAGRPPGLHTAALLSASALPVLTAAAAWSVRSSLYSHHQLLIVLLFLSHLGSAFGFAAYFEMVKWAVLAASGGVIMAFYLLAKYASEFTSVSLVRAAKLQWACAHMVPMVGLILAAALEVESGFARALVDFICETQDIMPTKMCIRLLRNADK